jgi:hypothetical protein
MSLYYDEWTGQSAQPPLPTPVAAPAPAPKPVTTPSAAPPPASAPAPYTQPAWVNQPPVNSNEPVLDASSYSGKDPYQSYEAAQGLATGYAPESLTTTNDMLVSQQLGDIMLSPVGVIAQQVAEEQMNSRGMMDSTAAIQAITMAAIQAGLPIAQADAAMFYDAAQTNMAAQNEARRFAAAETNTMTQRNLNAQDAASQFNIQAFQQQYNADREFAMNSFLEQSKLRQMQGESATVYTQDIWASGMKPEDASKAFYMGYENGILTWKQASEGVKNYPSHMVEVQA